MTSRDFCYWLQGYFEISKTQEVTKEAVVEIKKHLSMVFIHEIDPSHGSQQMQDKLNQIHNSEQNSPSIPVYRC